MNTTANITELRTEYMRVIITPYEMYEYGHYVRATRGEALHWGRWIIMMVIMRIIGEINVRSLLN